MYNLRGKDVSSRTKLENTWYIKPLCSNSDKCLQIYFKNIILLKAKVDKITEHRWRNIIYCIKNM